MPTPEEPGTKMANPSIFGAVNPEIAKLKAEITKLRAEFDEGMARAFAAVHNEFHKLGFAYEEALQKTKEVFRKP